VSPKTKLKDIESANFLTKDVFTGSSTEEKTEDKPGLFMIYCSNLIPPAEFFGGAYFDIESAVGQSCTMNKSYPIFEPYEQVLIEEPLDDDVVIRMPPVSTYRIKVKVRSVSKAVPRIADPETF